MTDDRKRAHQFPKDVHGAPCMICGMRMSQTLTQPECQIASVLKDSVMSDHKLTPEAWVDANDEGFHDVILGRVRAVQCDRVLQELKRLAKERDEWQANAEAAEVVAERQRERAKSAERERDAHRAAAEKAERERDDFKRLYEGECRARSIIDEVIASDAGKGLLSREQVRTLLVRAVNRASLATATRKDIGPGAVMDDKHVGALVDDVLGERDRG